MLPRKGKNIMNEDKNEDENEKSVNEYTFFGFPIQFIEDEDTEYRRLGFLRESLSTSEVLSQL